MDGLRGESCADDCGDFERNWYKMEILRTSENLANLGSRGAGLRKLEAEEWFTGPDWLLDEQQWPKQPDLKCSKEVKDERKL
mgnify:CR=1 FL=1